MTAKSYAESAPSVSPVLRQILDLRQKAKENLKGVRRKIVVIGGKGGVGKSTLTANLAAILAEEGNRVGVLDADVQGASLADMLGQSQPEGGGPIGPGYRGIQVASMGAIFRERMGKAQSPSMPQADAAWQSSLDAGILREFIIEATWGDLDFLLVDTPPASWEILTALIALVPDLEGALIVTQPSQAARSLLGRSISICEGLNLPVLGVVENMAQWECPHCGESVPLFAPSEAAPETSVPGEILHAIPFDPRLGTSSHAGKPFSILYPESPAGRALAALARSLIRLEAEKQSAVKSL